MHISRDVNFDEGFAYDASLNENDQAEIGEFWSTEDDEQLAPEEKEQESKMISKARKSDAVGVGAKDCTTVGSEVGESAGLEKESDAGSFLTTLEDDEPLTPTQSTDPPMTGSFPLEDDSDNAPTLNMISL